MSADRILIDTSVWIEYFRNQSTALVGLVAEAARSREICVPRVVMAELMQGAKSEREIAVIEQFMDAFTVIDQTEQTWLKAGRLSHELKRKGKNMSLTDCYIAVLALENKCAVFTLDKHFKDISRHTGLELLHIET